MNHTEGSVKQGYSAASLYNGEVKLRIENEGVFPDYCQDIRRLIRVDVKPVVTAKRTFEQNGNVLCEVEGIVFFNVIYSGTEENGVSSYTFSSDFEHNFKVSLPQNESFDTDSLASFCSAYSENVNCKAQGPRKMLLRSDVNLGLVLKCNKEFSFYDSASDAALGRLEALTSTVRVCRIVAAGDNEYTLSDAIKLPAEFMPIEEIIDCEAKTICDSAKPSDGRIVFDGSAAIHCSYRAEDGSLISFYQPIGFSQTLDLDGIDDECICDVRLTPSGLTYEIDVDSFGENRVLKFDLTYMASAAAMKNSGYELLYDSYGVNAEVKYEMSDADFCALVQNNAEANTVREKIQIKNFEFQSIESVKARIDYRSVTVENGAVEVNAKLYLTMMGIDGDGNIDAIRETLDVKIPVSTTPETLAGFERGDSKAEIHGDVRAVECQVSKGALDVIAEIETKILVFEQPSVKFIGKLEIADSRLVRSPEIIFYYPCSDDTLWSVGKKYKMSLERIKTVNHITDGKLPEVVKIEA